MIKERNRREIEAKLKGLGSFVKIDYLTRCLKQPALDFDTKRYVFLNLAQLYSEKKMFFEAGKMLQNAAPINTTIMEKMNDYAHAAEMFIKSGNFNMADVAFEKSISSCETEQQRTTVRDKKIDYYKKHAESCFSNDKRQNAMLAFEKLLSLNLAESEKKDAQIKLLGLYEKLGKIREYTSLKRVV